MGPRCKLFRGDEMKHEMPELLTIDEAAALLRVSKTTVSRLIQQKDLPSYKFYYEGKGKGRGQRVPVRIDKNDIYKFLQSSRVA